MTLTMFLVLGGLLPAEDRARDLHPQRRRRRGEELLVRGPGAAAARAGPGLRRLRVARQPHAAGSVGHVVLRGQSPRLPRAARAPAWHIGIAYFLWLGIFNVMVIAQFWAFAADVFTEEQGKRLFPLIGVGSSLGAWLGSIRAGPARAERGAGAAARRRGRRPGRLRAPGRVSIDRAARTAAPRQSAAADAKLAGRTEWLRLVFSDRYLMLIGRARPAAERRQHIGRVPVRPLRREHRGGDVRRRPGGGRRAASSSSAQTYSSYFGYVNLIGLLLQMFVVSRVFKFLGVGRSLLIHPIVALDRLRGHAARAVVRVHPLAEDRSTTASTTRSATRRSRRSGCRPAARPSTRPSRRSTRSASAPATSSRPASSIRASSRRSRSRPSRRSTSSSCSAGLPSSGR